jgi:hypothetical protein
VRQRDLSLASLVLLVVLGVRFMPQSTTVAGNPSSPKSTETAQPQAPEAIPSGLPEVWATLCRLNPDYVAKSYLADSSSGGDVKSSDPDPDCLKDLPGSVFPVIATIADPIRTHLRLWTDRTIEALQTAAAEVGYIPYMQALPWPAPTSSTNQPSQRSQYGPRQKYPGVLVFRNSNEKKIAPSGTIFADYLAVLVVPETPAGGIDQETFYAALHIIDKIPKAKGDDSKTPTVLVAGPNFSGSVSSLQDIDRELRNKSRPHCFHAYSGTITNAEYHLADSCSELHKLQTADHDALSDFATGVRSMGYSPSQIAILSEEGTEYGNQGDQQPQSNQAQDPTTEFLYLHFPRGIAILRNASGPAQSASTQAQGNIAQEGLSLSWQDADSGQSDEVPSYGRQTTAVSQETALSSVAQTLKRQGIKALGILATDPLDVTFMIHWFKQACPDVRLFVRDLDLLYLRTPDVSSPSGVLAVNNYTLFPKALWGSTDSQQKHLLHFPSSSQEGQYDAFTNLLYEIGYAPARSPEHPLWLTTTGTGAYFPIKWLTQADSAESALRNPGKPPYGAILLWALITGVALAHAAGLWRPHSVPNYFGCEFDLSDDGDAITAAKQVCHVIALFCIALAAMAAGSSFVYFFLSYPVIAFLVVASQVLLVWRALVAFRATLSVLKNLRGDKKLVNQHMIQLGSLRRAGAIVVALVVAGMLAWCISLVPNPTNRFFHWRNLNLTSGVAPVIPIVILLVTIYLGIWVYLRRISLWEYGSIQLPNDPMDDIFPSDCNPQVQSIDLCMLRLPPRPWGYILAVMWVTGIVVFRPWTSLGMFEPAWIRGSVIFWLGVAFLLLSANWLRFLAIWRELQEILSKLERLPLRAAFSRLPRDGPLSITGWSVPTKSFLPTRQAVETLRALESADPNLDRSVNKATQAVFDTIAEWMNDGIPQPVERAQKLGMAVGASGSIASMPDTSGREAATVEPSQLRLAQSTANKPQIQQPEKPAAPQGEARDSTEGQKERLQKIRAMIKLLHGLIPYLRKHWKQSEARDSTAKRKERLHKMRLAMTDLIHKLIPYTQEYWKRRETWHAGIKVVAGRERRKTDSPDYKYELAEDLIVLRYYSYVRYVCTEARNVLFFLVLAFVLLFAALHSYPFRAGRAIDVWFIVLFLVMGTGIVIVLLQLERNSLLSNLQNTKANKVGKNFYFDVLKYGAIPLLTLIGSQVPSISNFLLGWIQPNLEAFR